MFFTQTVNTLINDIGGIFLHTKIIKMSDNKSRYLFLKIITQKVILWLVKELLRYVVAIAVFGEVDEMDYDLLVEAELHFKKLFIVLAVAVLFILGSVKSCLVQELEDFLDSYDSILRSACLKKCVLNCLVEHLEELNGSRLHLKVDGSIFSEIYGFNHGKYLFDHMTTMLVLDHVQNLVWQQFTNF